LTLNRTAQPAGKNTATINSQVPAAGCAAAGGRLGLAYSEREPPGSTQLPEIREVTRKRKQSPRAKGPQKKRNADNSGKQAQPDESARPAPFQWKPQKSISQMHQEDDDCELRPLCVLLRNPGGVVEHVAGDGHSNRLPAHRPPSVEGERRRRHAVRCGLAYRTNDLHIMYGEGWIYTKEHVQDTAGRRCVLLLRPVVMPMVHEAVVAPLLRHCLTVTTLVGKWWPEV